MFNIKDSFLWFALFDRFTRLNQEDKRFVDFVIQFKGKLNCLETLMKNYFKIDIFSIPC